MNLFKCILPVALSISFMFCAKPPILINSENNPLQSHSDIVIKVKFNQEGNILASGGNDSDLIIWNGKNGNYLRLLKGEYDKIFDIVFMDSTHEIITANYSGTLLTWDDQKGIKKIEKLENNFITNFDFYFPGGFFIASSWETSLKVIKIDDHKLISSCKSGDYKIRTVKYSEKTKSIYGGTTAGNLMRWSIDQCTAGSNYNQKIHKDAITSMDINDDMNLMVTASVDGQIKLLNLSTLKEIGSLKGHKSPVNTIKIIPQSLKIASGDKDGKIFIWDIKTHGYVALSAHQDSINTLDVSPDGKLVASGSSDRTVKVWNLRKILSAGK